MDETAAITLKKLLDDWEDLDVAAYYLACCLGLMDYDKSFAKFREVKHVFWTGNELSDFLYEMLNQLVKLNILERNDDDFIRWNKSYKGYWEA